MKLSINNFTNFKQADIVIDGITVIAGENDTGKSTIGKALFSVFNSACNIDKKIFDQRQIEIKRSCSTILRDVLSHSRMDRLSPKSGHIFMSLDIARKIKSRISSLDSENRELDDAEIEQILRTSSIKYFPQTKEIEDDLEEAYSLMLGRIKNILNLPEDIIAKELISQYFSNVFNGQINSLTLKESKATVTVEVKGKKVNMEFTNNECAGFIGDTMLTHKAVYIDNPFVMDKLGTINASDYLPFGAMEENLADLIRGGVEKDPMKDVIATVLAKEKLEEINSIIRDVVGNVSLKREEGMYCIEKEGLKKPIRLESISTGLKSFVILKTLIENGCLLEKDVLVLDEPEIHLHPQWQIAYAELVVLLQKYFDLTIVVATHSPYFVDAINLYSVKHGVDKKTNYYVSSSTDDGFVMEQVTGDIEKVYKKMVTPIQILESLRVELSNN